MSGQSHIADDKFRENLQNCRFSRIVSASHYLVGGVSVTHYLAGCDAVLVGLRHAEADDGCVGRPH